MGFINNFTKPHQASLRRQPSCCSSLVSIAGSRDIPLKLKLKEPCADIVWKGDARAQPKAPAPSSDSSRSQMDMLQRVMDKTVEYDAMMTATTPRIKHMTREISVLYKDTPLRTLARDISWSNMDDLFASMEEQNPSMKVAIPKKKSPKKEPKPPMETVEVPAKTKDFKKAVATERRGHFKSSGQTATSGFSLRDINVPALSRTDRLAESKQRHIARARKGLGLNKMDLTACLDEALAISDPQAFQKTPRESQSLALPVMKSSSRKDDESISDSTTMDRSVHSSLSYIRMQVRSPFKVPRKVNCLVKQPSRHLMSTPLQVNDDLNGKIEPTMSHRALKSAPLYSSKHASSRCIESCTKVDLKVEIPATNESEVFA